MPATPYIAAAPGTRLPFTLSLRDGDGTTWGLPYGAIQHYGIYPDPKLPHLALTHQGLVTYVYGRNLESLDVLLRERRLVLLAAQVPHPTDDEERLAVHRVEFELPQSPPGQPPQPEEHYDVRGLHMVSTTEAPGSFYSLTDSARLGSDGYAYAYLKFYRLRGSIVSFWAAGQYVSLHCPTPTDVERLWLGLCEHRLRVVEVTRRARSRLAA